MGTDTTPLDQVTLTFASPPAAAGFGTVLRECASAAASVASSDRLTDLNLRLPGAPFNVAIGLASERIRAGFRCFAGAVE